MKNTRWMVVVWAIMLCLGVFGEDILKWWRGEYLTRVVDGDVDSIAAVEDTMAEEEEVQTPPDDSLFNSLVPHETPTLFQRFESTYKADFGRDFEYEVCVDFPRREVEHSAGIRRWLVEKFEEALFLHGETGYVVPKKMNRKRFYRGDIYADDKIGLFYSKRFFDLIRDDEIENDINYPYGLYQHFHMKAILATERFVSYRGWIENYYGGAHGTYVARVYSFDLVHQVEVDWNYLFKHGSRDSVLALVSDAAMTNPRFQYWEKGRFERMDDAEKHLFLVHARDYHGKPMTPQVGLCKDGVIFSYQVELLSCYAAGSFHFKVTKEKLAPYLTERGKWCLDVDGS